MNTDYTDYSQEQVNDEYFSIPHEDRIALELANLRASTDRTIAPLQDAVDLEMATAEEKKQLTAWKKYRVLLNRVPQQAGYPDSIDWPQQPA